MLEIFLMSRPRIEHCDESFWFESSGRDNKGMRYTVWWKLTEYKHWIHSSHSGKPKQYEYFGKMYTCNWRKFNVIDHPPLKFKDNIPQKEFNEKNCQLIATPEYFELDIFDNELPAKKGKWSATFKQGDLT